MGPTDSGRARLTLILVGLATLISFPLRVWPVGRLGFNQFDEGIYGMAASWVFQPGSLSAIDPSLIAYAPPGYPILVGLASFFLGSSDQPSFLVSATLGSLTVPVAAWISGRLFGPRAVVISAWCVCFSGPHIAFSRIGLTDTSFLLFFTFGLAAGIRFLETPRFGTALILGVLVGVAQQFKYNGWLVGGLVIVTAILGPLVSKVEREPRRLLRIGAWGGFAVLVSWIIVYPWFRFVEDHGGYSALLKHQRSYLTGPTAWRPNLLDQANQAVGLAGPAWLTLISGLAISLANWLISTNPDQGEGRRILGSIGVGGTITSLLAAPITSGFIFAPRLLADPRVGARLVGSGWLVLLVLSPFYHPYARLWLPFEMIHWIVLGGLAAWLGDLRFVDAPPNRHRLRRGLVIGSLGLVGLGFLSVGPGFPFASSGPLGHDGLFDPSDSLRFVAADVAKRVPPQVRGLRTLVRPALSFYLAGRVPASPQGDLDSFKRRPDHQWWGLVDSALLSSELGSPGRPAHRSPLEPIMATWELVAEFPSTTSLPTAFDLDPNHSRRPRDRSLTYLWLLRPRPLDSPR